MERLKEILLSSLIKGTYAAGSKGIMECMESMGIWLHWKPGALNNITCSISSMFSWNF